MYFNNQDPYYPFFKAPLYSQYYIFYILKPNLKIILHFIILLLIILNINNNNNLIMILHNVIFLIFLLKF